MAYEKSEAVKKTVSLYFGISGREHIFRLQERSDSPQG